MTYAQALAFVLKWEGLFSDNKADPGGRTMKGITQKTYDSYLALNGQHSKDVKNISDNEVADIYSVHYWHAAHCPQLPADLAPCVFNCAVNSGVDRAIKLLQRTLGVKEDGQVGPVTLAACKPGLAARYLDVHEQFYRSLVSNKPSLGVFLTGWINRLNSLRAALGVK